jgi:hypothetical protein
VSSAPVVKAKFPVIGEKDAPLIRFEAFGKLTTGTATAFVAVYRISNIPISLLFCFFINKLLIS